MWQHLTADPVRVAVNHSHWEVQWLSTRGWRGIASTKTDSREKAISKCLEFQKFYGKSAEFRVYEEVK